MSAQEYLSYQHTMCALNLNDNAKKRKRAKRNEYAIDTIIVSTCFYQSPSPPNLAIISALSRSLFASFFAIEHSHHARRTLDYCYFCVCDQLTYAEH